ncbi:Nramp family divalent metal transporter [Conexibacter sp. SYSU D00693]|uniref:Nramp family divalent metal transporter n=1 Tax=Conexibacter sp. SYSU D00693 TaxID=2812560 RepID=UPI001F11B0F5|nr:Nramp family divalent metal transporter [Conexibacter sp. SYSU D00693]
MAAHARRRRHVPQGRHLQFRLGRLRRAARPPAGALALLAVVGPGLLAGLSDDDPAGITTYSVLGAEHGYRLLWVLVASTVALVVFHELAVRIGVVTGKGLLELVRARHGRRAALLVAGTLVVANTATMAAEFAGVAAAADLLHLGPRWVAVPAAAVLVTGLVLAESFHRVEHVLLLLSAVFVAYVVAGVLAEPDWAAAGRGAVVPSLPGTSDGLLAVTATVGTTLAPWGLAFVQSYAVDKRLTPADLRLERVDVVAGAVLTGVIGAFIVIACAATLHVQGVEVDGFRDAATALEPLAGHLAATLFGVGMLGAALLAASVVPLSTAYSVAEAVGSEARLDDRPAQARTFYATFAATVAAGAGAVLVPGVPLITLLVLSQALNAVLLVVVLPVLRRLGSDRALMGEHALGRAGRAVTALVLVAVVGCVGALGALTLAG